MRPSSTCIGSTIRRTSGWCSSTAGLSAVLAYVTGAAALRRGDPRVLFISLAFLSAAGFLGLHALATPKVLLDTPNAGFTLATPVGVALGSVFAVLSSLNFSGDRVASAMRWGRWLRAGLLTLMALVGRGLGAAVAAAARHRRCRRLPTAS